MVDGAVRRLKVHTRESVVWRRSRESGDPDGTASDAAATATATATAARRARPMTRRHLLPLASLGVAVALGLLEAQVDELGLDVLGLPLVGLLASCHLLLVVLQNGVVPVFFKALVGAEKGGFL